MRVWENYVSWTVFSANGSNFTSLGMFPLHGFWSENCRIFLGNERKYPEDTHWIFLGGVKHKKQNDKSEQKIIWAEKGPFEDPGIDRDRLEIRLLRLH